MFKHQTAIRVRYSETDQMGVVYYGIYPQYFEVGRAEAMRSLGLSYAALEEKGILMPVVKLSVKYIRSAKYDDLLNLETKVLHLPEKRITFVTRVYKEDDLLTIGEVTLAFVDKENQQSIHCPREIMTLLSPFFE